MQQIVRIPVLALAALTLASPAPAACRLALVLGMDVSRSVDATDFAIQTEGLAAALEDKAVREAIFGPAGEVAIAAYQWSGEAYQEVLVDWTVIRSPADLDRIARDIRQSRQPEMRLLTALGEGLAFGHDLLEAAPVQCRRRVIDMAGDGQNNQGRSPARVYRSAEWDGITVNALAIRAHEMGLVTYFATELIRGPGAFVELAERHEDFPPAIRRKLIREFTEALASRAPVPGTDGKS